MDTKLFALLFSLLLFCDIANINAQPVVNGHLVGTCYSGTNPGGFVVGLYDVRLAALQTPNQNWIPPMSHGPTNNWTAANLGEVFGVDFDAAGNIYVTATKVYSSSAPPGGPGGAGAVYRIDGVTGAISNFVTTLPTPCGPVVGTTTLPNSGVGLGNIAHDPVNNQFFVTNFEDGKIYRISAAGVVLSAFDPFAADACVAGTVPLGERVWGVNVYNSRVYFARWREDQGPGHYSSGTYNEIWSVALSGGDFFGTATLEIQIPNLGANQYSNPVSDIAFSAAGKMLLAERSMYGEANDPLYPSAHQSRLLEYVLVSGVWVPSGANFSVGFFSGDNSAGGCDYGYGAYNPQTRLPEKCDSTVWVSADALHYNGFNDNIYGWGMLPASGGDTAVTVMVDADGDTLGVDKLQIGDLEVYKSCESTPDDPCKGIRVTSKQLESSSGQVECCHELTISGLGAGLYSSISAQLLDDSISITGVIGPTGWGVTNTGTYATWDSAGMIPGGTVTGLRFCLYSLAVPPQRVEITFHGLDGSICRDTLVFDCPQMPPPFPPCVRITEQEVECRESGPNGSVYDLSFVVTNNSPFSLPPYNLPAENLVVYPVTPNVFIAPGNVTFGPPLGYGSSSGSLPFTISGSGANPGDTVCIVVQLHGKKLQHDYQWCCPPDTLCIVLPECRDCCEEVDIAVKEERVRQVGNNGAQVLSSISVAPGPVTSATATVIGVTRSDVWCPKKGPGGWVWVKNGNGGSLATHVTSASITPTLPLAWGITPPSSGVGWGTVPAGVSMGGQIGLQLAFPGSSLGWRCRDTLTICVRYSFTDTACRTCDTLVYYRLPRTGTIEIIEVDPVDLGLGGLSGRGGAPSPGTEPVSGDLAGMPRATGPTFDLEMSDPTSGILSMHHWWQDDLEGDSDFDIVELRVMSPVGWDLSSIGEIGGNTGRVVEGVGLVATSLAKGETNRYQLRWAAGGTPEFPTIVRVAVRGTLASGTGPDDSDTVLSGPYDVVADLARTGDTGRIRIRRIDKATPMLYRLAVSTGDYDTVGLVGRPDYLAPTRFTITVPDGVNLLATGPTESRDHQEIVVVKSIDKATPLLFQAYGPPEYELGSIGPNQTVPLTIVVDGQNAGGPFDLIWRGYNDRGEVIAEGTVTLDSATSSVGDGRGPGSSIHLLEAWPNPVSGDLSTAFRIDRGGEVTLRLLDLAGREVMRPIDRVRHESGRIVETLDLGRLPEGTYVLHLDTPDGVQTRKVVVVR